MKICLLNDSFPPLIDGVANVVVNYASRLSQYSDVLVATPEYPGTDYAAYPYQIVAYPSADTASLTGGYRAGYPFAIKELGKMAEFGPEIIHTHCPIASMFMARSLREMTGAPLILTYHTKYDEDIRRCVHGHFLQEEGIRALIHNISAADEVWTVSEGAGENLRSLGYEGEYRVVQNGVDFEKGRVSDEEIAEAVRGYDLPEDLPVFLFVGRLMNYKGLPLLIEALAKLSEETDYRAVLIGSGSDEETLKQKTADCGIPYDETESDGTIVSHTAGKKGKVIFTGPIRDRQQLRAWNCRADLFVFPSTFDTNGLVVREAAACSLASLMIRGSCAAEGITDGRNGFLCEEDSDSIFQMLKYACANRRKLREAGEMAMNEIYISWDSAVRQAYGLYGELKEKKLQGLLRNRKMLGDDPLYEMAADAAEKYIQIMSQDIPVYEGMLDNLYAAREQIADDIQQEISQNRKRLKDLISLLK